MAKERRDEVAQTAFLTAGARVLARRTDPPDIANDDWLATEFLQPVQRILLSTPRLNRWLAERFAPGAIGYFSARTRHFDALLAERAAELEQLVVLGAGFDTRALRFADRLRGACVFELDVPAILDLKRDRLARRFGQLPPHLQMVPVDLDSDDLGERLSAHGYDPSARTMFLWEGVTMYLTEDRVDDVLAFVGAQSPAGSTVVFDYVTRVFFEGDHTSYGAKPLADGWRRNGNLNRSGVESVKELVERHGLSLVSDLDASELERRYLTSSSGTSRRAWGALRIADARV